MAWKWYYEILGGINIDDDDKIKYTNRKWQRRCIHCRKLTWVIDKYEESGKNNN